MSLIASMRSETAKVFTTSAWWILALVMVLYVGALAGGLAGVFGAVGTSAAGLPAGSGLTDLIYTFATSVGYVFPVLIGTLMVTTEFRHKTLTPTFLATPRRGVALTGKLLVGVLVGLVYGLLALASSVGPGAGMLAVFGIPTGLGELDTWLLFARSLLALVLWTLFGIGLGALVRNQVAAIVIVLAFTQFVEPMLRLAGTLADGVGTVTAYLPGAASDALVGVGFLSGMGGAQAGAETLSWWGGGLVLLGYVLVLVVLGGLTSWRRDLT